ncbi:MAG: asparagine synthetase B, partial [Clostridia bacterium]|nr:asparagine synthetase B [Clostridia bacterium]
MCSIMGLSSYPADYDEFKKALAKTESRGPDDNKVINAGNGLLAFQRLAIMDLNPTGMQPFELGENKIVCNGEIYGFRKIKKELEKEYTFRSDSDCEILLPLYEKYGFDMFAMLDAEYALVIYDGKKKCLIAARDPIGIRPLFYGYD